MNNEINSILNRLKDLFFELEKQIKFEENNKHEIDNKKLSKYEKNYIGSSISANNPSFGFGGWRDGRSSFGSDLKGCGYLDW